MFTPTTTNTSTRTKTLKIELFSNSGGAAEVYYFKLKFKTEEVILQNVHILDTVGEIVLASIPTVLDDSTVVVFSPSDSSTAIKINVN